MDNFLGIIPARGGSKRIPKKNLVFFHDKPLISYTIKEAKKSQYIKRLIVSTDNKEIASYALKLGVEVPFLRPARYAKDNSPIIDTLYLMHKWALKNQLNFDGYVLLQPTSPLRKAKHINECIALYKKTKADTVVSVRFASEHPFWMWRYNNHQIKPFFSIKKMNVLRFKLPPVVIENGAIYIIKPAVLEKKMIYGSKIVPYVMDKESSYDIDTFFDLKKAEKTLKK